METMFNCFESSKLHHYNDTPRVWSVAKVEKSEDDEIENLPVDNGSLAGPYEDKGQILWICNFRYEENWKELINATQQCFPEIDTDEITHVLSVNTAQPEWLLTVSSIKMMLAPHRKPKRLSKAKAMEAFINEHQENQSL